MVPAGTQGKTTLKRLTVLLLLLACSGLARPALADPALWVVRGPNATVYLLGSVHLLRKETVWQDAAIRRAFDAASECWFEIEQPADPQQMQASVVSSGLDPAHKLSDLLPPAERPRLSEVAAAAGLGETVQIMRPWLAAIVLAVQPLVKSGYDPAYGVDTVLQAQAKAAGKRVAGIETIEAQMHLLTDLPQDLAVKLLVATLDDAAKGSALMEEIIRTWQAGDVDAIEAAVTSRVRTEAPDLYQIIFAQRNETFVHAVQELAAGSKTVLVTVGAGHLAGPGSVVDLLEKRGIKIERVTD